MTTTITVVGCRRGVKLVIAPPLHRPRPAQSAARAQRRRPSPGGDQEQKLDRWGKVGCAGREYVLQALRQRNQVRHQLILVEPVRDRRQLHESQRIARTSRRMRLRSPADG